MSALVYFGLSVTNYYLAMKILDWNSLKWSKHSQAFSHSIASQFPSFALPLRTPGTEIRASASPKLACPTFLAIQNLVRHRYHCGTLISARVGFGSKRKPRCYRLPANNLLFLRRKYSAAPTWQFQHYVFKKIIRYSTVQDQPLSIQALWKL